MKVVSLISSVWTCMISSLVLASSRSECWDSGSECHESSIAPELGSALLQKAHVKARTNLDTGATFHHESTEKVFLELSQPSNGIGTTAPLNEAGYQDVAATCCNIEIRDFTARLVSQLDLVVCDQGGLSGLVIWYNCGNTSSLNSLIINILASQPPTTCAFVAEAGMCPAEDSSCYGQFNADAFKKCPSASNTTQVNAAGQPGPSTQLTRFMPTGSTTMPVVSSAGFAIGDPVYIQSAAGSETNVVAGFGSLILMYPTKFTYPSGTTIIKLALDDPKVSALPEGSITSNSTDDTTNGKAVGAPVPTPAPTPASAPSVGSIPAPTPAPTPAGAQGPFVGSEYCEVPLVVQYCSGLDNTLYEGMSEGKEDCESRCNQDADCQFISFWENTNYCITSKHCDETTIQNRHIKVSEKCGSPNLAETTTQGPLIESEYCAVPLVARYCSGPDNVLFEGMSGGKSDCESKCNADSDCHFISFWENSDYCITSKHCDDQTMQNRVITVSEKCGSAQVENVESPETEALTTTQLPNMSTTTSITGPATTTTTGPFPADEDRNGSFRVFIGCFKDASFNRAMPIRKGIQSFDGCAQECEGSKYFGREGERQCFCGDSYGKYGESSYCNCEPDAAFIGWFQQCLYEYKAFTTTTTTTASPKVMGCFAEYSWDHDLPYDKGVQTFKGCMEACQGYKYFGRQGESQCFCGDSYGKHGVSDLCTDCTDFFSSSLGWWCQCVYEYVSPTTAFATTMRSIQKVTS